MIEERHIVLNLYILYTYRFYTPGLCYICIYRYIHVSILDTHILSIYRSLKSQKKKIFPAGTGYIHGILHTGIIVWPVGIIYTSYTAGLFYICICLYIIHIYIVLVPKGWTCPAGTGYML